MRNAPDRNGQLFTIREAWKELRKEHPNGTLGFDLIPRANFSIQYVEAMPETAPDDSVAYFDEDAETAFIVFNSDGTDEYLTHLGAWLVNNLIRTDTRLRRERHAVPTSRQECSGSLVGMRTTTSGSMTSLMIMASHVIASVWEPTQEERAAIANGENIRLLVWGDGIPPFAMDTTDEPLGKTP